MLHSFSVSYQTNLKYSIFQVWLIACCTKCLGPSLVDISKEACIFLPCATGGTNFEVILKLTTTVEPRLTVTSE